MSSFAKRVIKSKRLQKVVKVQHDTVDNPFLLALSIVGPLTRTEIKTYEGPLRASGLCNVCLREHCIGRHLNVVKKKTIDAQLKLIFGIGNAVHTTMQNDPVYFGDKLIGFFLCHSCKKVLPFQRRPKACPVCGSEYVFYKEAQVALKGLIQGHIDIFVEVGKGIIRIVDVKTLTADEFNKLKDAKYEDKFQLCTYQFLVDATQNKFPAKIDCINGYIFYVPKQHPGKGKFPIKAFRVERDSLTTETIKSTLKTFNSCIDRETGRVKEFPPPLVSCIAGDWGAYRPRSCPVGVHCKSLYKEENK